MRDQWPAPVAGKAGAVRRFGGAPPSYQTPATVREFRPDTGVKHRAPGSLQLPIHRTPRSMSYRGEACIGRRRRRACAHPTLPARSVTAATAHPPDTANRYGLGRPETQRQRTAPMRTNSNLGQPRRWIWSATAPATPHGDPGGLEPVPCPGMYSWRERSPAAPICFAGPEL